MKVRCVCVDELGDKQIKEDTNGKEFWGCFMTNVRLKYVIQVWQLCFQDDDESNERCGRWKSSERVIVSSGSIVAGSTPAKYWHHHGSSKIDPTQSGYEEMFGEERSTSIILIPSPIEFSLVYKLLGAGLVRASNMPQRVNKRYIIICIYGSSGFLPFNQFLNVCFLKTTMQSVSVMINENPSYLLFWRK